jgi:hypothetical protein
LPFASPAKLAALAGAEASPFINPSSRLMNNKSLPAIHRFRLCSATLGLAALIVKFVATLAAPAPFDQVTAAITVVSYFTVLSNLLAIALFIVPELAGDGAAAHLSCRYEIRTAAGVYMIITGLIYAAFLAGLAKFGTVQYFTDIILHYVMPPLYVIDWLQLRPTHKIAWGNAGYFLVFPILYALYTLARGALVGVYPYPFVDVGQLGYQPVLVKCGQLLILCLILSILAVAVGRWRARPPSLQKSSRS